MWGFVYLWKLLFEFISYGIFFNDKLIESKNNNFYVYLVDCNLFGLYLEFYDKYYISLLKMFEGRIFYWYLIEILIDFKIVIFDKYFLIFKFLILI